MIKEWENEPNEKKFNYKGFECLILRHDESKHLCGYVAIPKIYSEIYEVSYEDLEINVHGGLTFSAKDADRFDEKFWTIGFDCAHVGDLIPCLIEVLPHFERFGDTYKNIAYVEKECKSIVDQIIEKYGVR
jgi:hypothetical protein